MGNIGRKSLLTKELIQKAGELAVELDDIPV